MLRSEAMILLASQQVHRARTVDVSRVGLAISSDLNLRPPTALRIRFGIPTEHKALDWVDADATVMNCVLSNSDGGFRAGLQITRFHAGADAIARFLSGPKKL